MRNSKNIKHNNWFDNKIKEYLKPLSILLFYAGYCFVIIVAVSFVIMILWNSVVPQTIGFSTINWVEGAILYCLCWILFKGNDMV